MSEEGNPPDLASLKEAIRDGWDAIAEEWDSWTPIVEAWFGPATKLLLEMLDLKPGDRVLELAAGTGALTTHLAAAVGPDGRVTATDAGSNMVKLAARNARTASLSNVNVRVMDGENPDVTWASMDAVACRQGFMFFTDPAGALQRLHRVLRPGGRIGLTVFSPPDRNGFMATPANILTRWTRTEGETPTRTGGPGPFSLGEPGLLAGMLAQAGFIGIESRLVSCPLHMPTMSDLLRFYHDILGDRVADLSPADQAKVWAEVAEACAGYVGVNSPGAPCELIVIAGRRPAVAARKG